MGVGALCLGRIRLRLAGIRVAVGTVSILLLLPLGVGSAYGTTGSVGFWIPTESNALFDRQTVGFLAKHGAIIVVRAPVFSENGEPSLKEVVDRFREQAPKIPVFLYTWAGRYNERWNDRRNNIDAQLMKGFWDLDQKQLLLRDQAGRPLPYGDVRQPQFRKWMAAGIQNALAETGADGIALDLAFRTPRPKEPAGAACKRLAICEKYGEGMDALLRDIGKSIAPKKVGYNGLWNDKGISLNDQLKLLQWADFAAVEYFGLVPEQDTRQSFADTMLPIIDLLGRHQGKSVLVYGRGRYKYDSYEDDYLWQRYLYGAYLLGAGSNTTFKYHASFATPAHLGRSGGMDVYEDWALPLGAPKGPYTKSGNVFSRPFERGLVLVVPHDAAPAMFSLTRRMYDGEGNAYDGSIRIAPGVAMILLDAPFMGSPATVAFKPGGLGSDWRWASYQAGSDGGAVLRLDGTPAEFQYEHDVLLDPVRKLRPGRTLELKGRSRDARGSILLVAEVDDNARLGETVGFVVVEIVAASKSGNSEVPLPRFRQRTGPATVEAIQVVVPELFGADAGGVRIDGSTIVDPKGRYKFRRWSFMRPIGKWDLVAVQIIESPADRR